jgi:hypothetical protein
VKRALLVLGLMVPVYLASVALTIVPASEKVIFAPASVVSGTEFVASLDIAGCVKKAPAVAWSLPAECVVTEGQGTPSAKIRCLGANGTQVALKATATGGRPPAACNGMATSSTVLAGAPVDACPPLAGPNSVELRVRLAAAQASAPAGVRSFVAAAQLLADPAPLFASLKSEVHCASPEPHPQHPENVSAAELRAWLKGPLAGFSGLASTLSDADLVWVYRRMVEANRGLPVGSLR